MIVAMGTTSFCLIHTPLINQQSTNLDVLSSTMKSRSGFIVSLSRGNNEKVQKRRITSKRTHVDSRKSLGEILFDTLDRAIVKFIDPPLQSSVNPNYVLCDNFRPVDELSPIECDIIHGSSSILSCLEGVYIRIGPNPQFTPNGPHHYFDGNGMMQSIRFSQGRATFCCRYVKTNKYLFEHQAGSYIIPNIIGGMQDLGPFIARAALFAARCILGQYDYSQGFGVANTSIVHFGGRVYALCESDLPYEIKVKNDGDIITLGRHDSNGNLTLNMTTHPKVDPETKEAFAFRYWATYPYMTYFRFDANGDKQPDVPIFSMKQSSLTHDMAITQKYAIIFDIQLGADPMNFIRGRRLVSFDPTKVPKIGILPRLATNESGIKWFDAPGLNVLHVVNAWDEIDDDGSEVVVLVASNILQVEHLMEQIHMIEPCMEIVTIHFRTGVVSRKSMSTNNFELPVINQAYVAKKNRYFYSVINEKRPLKSSMVRTLGVVKLDITASSENNTKDRNKHIVASRMYGENCFGGEPYFVARDPDDPNSEEDDGYVVSYVHDESSGKSKFVAMDARSPSLEIVVEVKLPQRVPYGLHGIFIRENDL
ncbi:zeaxanthin 7,8(7',8')-cleavage dioxygenase, chromoplastic-like [Rutidosis leptorrhynchoides]|uniref:zeaxanthin 7,8(7',8')-cleavage dioxygenase, chromoplastic-like n=1 Tax=Rutidosis leptorrhynchoides TaxID=125765 RepID=UPI003A9973D5